jgi:HD-like signal output (HDOD) protein
MFNGDIARFSPADLLTFLTHLRKEGVLAVTCEDESLSISFRDGLLVDANSETADVKVLRALYMHKLIDKGQFDDISRARKETGLPLKQILENIESFQLSRAGKILGDGIQEVMFQLFLWESGQFQFTEITVEQNEESAGRDCESLMLDTARQVDEYRETLRNISSVDRKTILTAPGREAADTPLPVRYALIQAEKNSPVRQIVASAPFTSYEAMKAIQTSLDQGWIELGRSGDNGPSSDDVPVADKLFFSCKRSLRKVILAKDPRQKVKEVVNFCKDHFDYTLFIASNQNQIHRAMRFSRTSNGQLDILDIPNVSARIDGDQTFDWVCKSKHPFAGKVFSSPLLEGMGELPPAGDCAIVPLGNIDGSDYLVYVASAGETQSPGPFQYLELLSWHVNPPVEEERKKTRPEAQPGGVDQNATAAAQETESDSDNGLVRMVETIKELPPMPHVVTRILKLLTDPDSKMSDITEILSHDQALVARLIKISNSAFYGRGTSTSTLSQAVIKLGTKTLRSIVITASTRSLFPTDQTNTGIWGQALWQHSVECGLASRRVAELVHYKDPEEAFVGGVLHDIGKLVVLLNLPDEFRQIRKTQTSSRGSSADAEQAVLGFDHTQVGKLLLEKWQLPKSLRACVRYHHHPQESGDYKTLAYITGCGDYLSRTLGSQPDVFQAGASVDLKETLIQLNLTEDFMESIQEEIVELFSHCDVLD